ncbi:MAG: FkbM family methyltransferase [Cyanobacteriota bacterium]|nr:FkbM family methyltransferase [Cyanobacteriota bacterium]
MPKVIYDVGSNNGNDIPYYLLKAEKVIAVEANPALCEGIRQRFADEIAEGRLVVEACVVTADEGIGEVDFYLHKSYHVLSQLGTPADHLLEQYTRVRLPTKSILSIIQSHGDPHYIKIDIEHYDDPLLKALFAGGIRPPYISAEAHSPEVFFTLVREGGYQAFKLVNGYFVPRDYAGFVTESGISHTFPFHSAGPYGNDIHGAWMNVRNFFQLLAYAGLGWSDIHATNVEPPDPSAKAGTTTCLEYLDRDELITSLKQILSGKELLSLLQARASRLFNLS